MNQVDTWVENAVRYCMRQGLGINDAERLIRRTRREHGVTLSASEIRAKLEKFRGELRNAALILNGKTQGQTSPPEEASPSVPAS